VKNPLRSEAEAYRFLLSTVVYFAAIVLASLVGGTWWGVGVFAVLTAAAAVWFFQREQVEPPPPAAPVHQGAEDEKRILVIANETVGGRKLRELIRQRAEGTREEVLVVTPALNTPLKHWVSDEDKAREAAQKRLEESVRSLREAGVNVRGEVGDGDPLQAMEDALRTFGADEIVISTHPEGRSHWLERGVVSGARERFAVPITHIVVDLEQEREEVRG
jgi:nucleotide-binding universal stress UspA family protein